MKVICTLVGMQYRHSEELVKNLKPGEVLELRRAPDNEHDKNAIEVWYGALHIAFIKAVEAASLAHEMDYFKRSKWIGKYVIGGDRWPQVEIDW